MRSMLFALAMTMPAAEALAEAGGGRLAIMPVKLLDTSNEARDQTADHVRRLGIMAEMLAADMPGRPVAPEAVDAACPRQSADCLMELLRQQGAERGLFVVVQKSSTLILQAFASLVDIRTGELIQHRELGFRGDNDQAWRHAGRFLARQLREDD